MSQVTRFSVSLDKGLLEKFDRQIRSQHYPTRSKAIGDLIRGSLIREQWVGRKTVAGAIVLVYDHHKRDLANKLTRIQHEFHRLIVSSQHVHLDHRNCFEIVVVKGKPEAIATLARRLRTTKGVKHGSLMMATTGKEL
jgi:CopG family nickel-responsive transcriptional regulator